MEKYLSIITNFGCHYKCPYCIVKKNNLCIPKTTIGGLENLVEAVKKTGCNIISISGGGDPLYEYEQHIDWYRELFGNIRQHFSRLPFEMHTSYMTDESTFPFYDCHRVVYHTNTFEQLGHIHRTGNEQIRVVYVVTEDFTLEDIMRIAKFVEDSREIDELSFRQMIDEHYEEKHFLEEYLRLGHKKLWWYIEQKDYNLYYAENQVYTEYKQFRK